MTLGPGGNNLLEDCALFGRGRKVVAAGSDGGNGNTIRRCWVRHEGHQGTDGNPSNPYEIGYMQNTVTSENVIVTANTFGFGVTSAQVLLAMFSSVGSALLGSIGYYDGSSAWGSGAGIGQFWLAGGSHAGEGNCTKDAVVRDVVGIITPAYVEYASNPKGLEFNSGGCGTGPHGNNIADNIIGVAPNITAVCQAPDWMCTQYSQGTTIAAAIGAGVSMWDRVPGLCKRYVNRTLTSQGLWPWPMNQRTKDALVASGRAAVDVTATMESLFGSILPPAPRAQWRGHGPCAPSSPKHVGGYAWLNLVMAA